MRTLNQFVFGWPRAVVVVWAMLLALAAVPALRLPGVVQGSSDAIEASESGRVAAILEARYGRGGGYLISVVVQSDGPAVDDPAFAAGANAFAEALLLVPGVKSVEHAWNTGESALIGRDRHSALLLVRPDVRSFFDAENLIGRLRTALSEVRSPDLRASVTGMPAIFYDLNRRASRDMLRAESIGLPLALIVLLCVFRAPLAALLPLVVAISSVTVARAGLYLLSDLLPVSVFAQNAVTMIGLAVGIDYALFLLSRFRQQLAAGDSVQESCLRACRTAGSAVMVSGATVGIGLAGLFLVRAKFIHSVAIGGLLVVGVAVAATVTLLPLLLVWLGPKVNWPFAHQPIHHAGRRPGGRWHAWISAVLRHPGKALLAGVAISAVLATPALRMTTAAAGVRDLPVQAEARRGLEVLEHNFEAGWMGPVTLALEASPASTGDEARRTVHDIAARLARVLIDDSGDPSSRTALLFAVTRHSPDSTESLRLVRALRADPWPTATRAGLTVKVGGAAAMIHDFDAELQGSLHRVIPAVLGATFVVLLLAFRSVLIPVKAVVLNLLAIASAWGLLVLLFQDGLCADFLGIDPPGGLNSLVMLMLFTILFGISMDYEVLLLQQVSEAHSRGGNNVSAVRDGVARSAALITGAAVIMIVLFGSFAFTGFTATREFGLGLAFAVAFDATFIRLLLAPALMGLAGAANWWWPFARNQKPVRSLLPSAASVPRGSLTRREAN